MSEKVSSIPYLYEDIIASDALQKEMAASSSLCDFMASQREAQGKSDSASQVEINKNLIHLYQGIKDMHWRDAKEWILEHQKAFSEDTMIIDSMEPEDLLAYPVRDPKLIICLHSLNDARHMNTFLSYANYKLQDGGTIMLHGITSGMRRELIRRKMPFGMKKIGYGIDYVWSRIMPKLDLTRWLYMSLTGGKNRSFPRVEILGRISRAGFTIIEDEMRCGQYYVSAVKTKKPIRLDKPSYGPLIRLKRIGYKGKLIDVYKFRTMYAYSEYIQAYVYQQVGLQEGGKLNHDFRVNFWGKALRKVWLDELPMIWNLLKGELKLVGVRPLSRHYFSLYTPEMQELRITVKPGLFPPFYYEKVLPKTIEDVQASERRYIEAYHKAPLKTDLKYFFGTLYNIVVRKARSH